MGPYASQYGPGAYGTDNLSFSGTVAGSYDTFSQSFATVAGQAYTVDFDYINANPSAPSGFTVATSAGAAATPLPRSATAGLSLLGVLGLAGLHRRRAAIA